MSHGQVKKEKHIDSGDVELRCPICKSLLYDSYFPKPQGQYNLINAKYCPECGVKFEN